MMSGGRTSLGVLDPALANIPVLTSTWKGGPPTDIKPKSYQMPGYLPQGDAQYFRLLCVRPEPDDCSEPESEERFNPDDKWFDPH